MPSILWILWLVVPIIILGLVDIIQTKHTIRRNFPVIGNFRYLLEDIRPEIMQYFVETDTEGRPINRIFRSLIYQRAKKANDTTPFGTQMDVYAAGYEWMDHSIYANNHADVQRESRILVGGEACLKPYSASILNISAMSFGSLSKNAVLAMNTGAKIGGFAHNTGEGGISPYHKQPGGDLIWQIGTGYFGCRTEAGNFCEENFQKNSTMDNVKMVEIKISQGAKPGHGGILPASKNTEEIAAIRHVKPHTDVHSPPKHSAFDSAEGLMHFIQKLRDLSGGKPIGFKICIGKKEEFIELCKAMVSLGIKPDFITIDGGEGGTGAAPIEFSNSLGMPLKDGLSFAIDTLRGFDLKKDIKVIASGKVLSGFDIARVIAMGADMVNSARAMMMATGCIQALQCNVNTCPTGVATQNKSLMAGLVVEDKSQRVANFHEETVKSFIELIAASGIRKTEKLNREHINRRIGMNQVLKYSEIYPEVPEGSYLEHMMNGVKEKVIEK
ncbi:FMN-binding glutamate synthase family protein [Cyclobacterium qasimii]|uniref:FMN-binding glutamate synthase family protein n=2 Tax=Cyclobacterium qasimii TaxID=1350429 RepID=A0A512C8N4_9BACT|nr:FMN-binding glutamate synthase family protein [Cyclobacterium qasimii]